MRSYRFDGCLRAQQCPSRRDQRPSPRRSPAGEALNAAAEPTHRIGSSLLTRSGQHPRLSRHRRRSGLGSKRRLGRERATTLGTSKCRGERVRTLLYARPPMSMPTRYMGSSSSGPAFALDTRSTMRKARAALARPSRNRHVLH
jgi:hypothetical protein